MTASSRAAPALQKECDRTGQFFPQVNITPLRRHSSRTLRSRKTPQMAAGYLRHAVCFAYPCGKELYYIAPDGTLMAAPIAVNGATIEPGRPAALFRTRVYGRGTDVNVRTHFDD